MYDLLFHLSNFYPAWLIIFFMSVSVIVGAFVALSIGSFRWWYVKRTRMPQLMRSARAVYEAEIADLRRRNKNLWDRLQRAQTAAYGQVIIQFRDKVVV